MRVGRRSEPGVSMCVTVAGRTAASMTSHAGPRRRPGVRAPALRSYVELAAQLDSPKNSGTMRGIRVAADAWEGCGHISRRTAIQPAVWSRREQSRTHPRQRSTTTVVNGAALRHTRGARTTGTPRAPCGETIARDIALTTEPRRPPAASSPGPGFVFPARRAVRQTGRSCRSSSQGWPAQGLIASSSAAPAAVSLSEPTTMESRATMPARLAGPS